MKTPEKGSGVAFKQPYTAHIDWDTQKARIRVVEITLRSSHSFPTVEMARPVDPEALSQNLRKDGIPPTHVESLIHDIRQELFEL